MEKPRKEYLNWWGKTAFLVSVIIYPHKKQDETNRGWRYCF